MIDTHSKRKTQLRSSQSLTAPLSSSLDPGAHSVAIGVIIKLARVVLAWGLLQKKSFD